VQAHTLGEVGNLGTVLLRVYSGTLLPIFIEIGRVISHIWETRSKKQVGTVFWDTVYNSGTIEITADATTFEVRCPTSTESMKTECVDILTCVSIRTGFVQWN